MAKTARKILEEDWSEYDDRKKKKTDAKDFACTEDWERDYLMDKIRKNHPDLSIEKIKTAIEQCCKSVAPPRPRKEFVECVTKRLGLEDDTNGGGNPPPPPAPGPSNPPSPPSNRKVG